MRSCNTIENKNIMNALTSDTCSAEPSCCKNDATALLTANPNIKADMPWLLCMKHMGRVFNDSCKYWTSVRMQILNHIELAISITDNEIEADTATYSLWRRSHYWIPQKCFNKLSIALTEQCSVNVKNREWFPLTCVAQLFHSIPSKRFTSEPGRPQLHNPEESVVMLRKTMSKVSAFIMFFSINVF